MNSYTKFCQIHHSFRMAVMLAECPSAPGSTCAMHLTIHNAALTHPPGQLSQLSHLRTHASRTRTRTRTHYLLLIHTHTHTTGLGSIIAWHTRRQLHGLVHPNRTCEISFFVFCEIMFADMYARLVKRVRRVHPQVITQVPLPVPDL